VWFNDVRRFGRYGRRGCHHVRYKRVRRTLKTCRTAGIVFSRASLSSSLFLRCSVSVDGDYVARERDGRPDRRIVSPPKLNRSHHVRYYYRNLCARKRSTFVSRWRAADDRCCEVAKPVESFIVFSSKFSTRSLTRFAVIPDPVCTIVWRWLMKSTRTNTVKLKNHQERVRIIRISMDTSIYCSICFHFIAM